MDVELLFTHMQIIYLSTRLPILSFLSRLLQIPFPLLCAGRWVLVLCSLYMCLSLQFSIITISRPSIFAKIEGKQEWIATLRLYAHIIFFSTCSLVHWKMSSIVTDVLGQSYLH